MTRFRPCIDLHRGRVKQIVGGTLTDDAAALQVNFESARPAAYYADLYRRDGLSGGHVIQLGTGNAAAARAALAAYPGGMHVGGGIRADNAARWLDAGASHVIVTSFLFEDAHLREDRLDLLVRSIGAARLVIDLSCRARGATWVVAVNRWQTLTDLEVAPATLDRLADRCDEFLIHAADVEGRCAGIDERLVAMLGRWGRRPVVYAGGARGIDDLARVDQLSDGRVDLTIGSALDLFGGQGVRYADCVAFNRRRMGGASQAPAPATRPPQVV
jgi:phosphoribosylformimino-5-aminoimidazole carboxamide ribotide isomerase